MDALTRDDAQHLVDVYEDASGVRLTSDERAMFIVHLLAADADGERAATPVEYLRWLREWNATTVRTAHALFTGKTAAVDLDGSHYRTAVTNHVRWYVETYYPAEIKATNHARRLATLRRESARWQAVLADLTAQETNP